VGFLDRLRGNRSREQRAVVKLNGIPSNSEGYSVDSGVVVSDQSALRVTAVFACVGVIADGLASLPMDAYRKQGELRVPLDPMPSLIAQPLRSMTTFEWVFQVVTSLALRGNAFLLVVGRDSLERVTDLQPLHPDWVRVDVNRETGKLVYSVLGEEIPNYDILHIRRFSLAGCPLGLSPIDQARQGIGMALAAERYGARYFGQSANPSATLTTDSVLSPEQSENLKTEWIASQGGTRYPAVLSGGLKYEAISITPEESQFLQTREFQNSDIAMLFRVPPHMIGQTNKSTSWGTGIEQQSIGFVRYTLQPYITCIEQALSTLLPRGQYARFNVDALLRSDSKSRFESYVQARNAGWLNVNEIRALEDRLPVENGDSYIQPLNMGPLGTDPTQDGQSDTQGDPNGPQV
jgi:HK97 family phage portal protein